MTLRTNQVLVALASGALFLSLPQQPALAQRPQYVGGIPGATPGRVTGIALGLAGVSAGITIGVYAVVKHNHSVTGCARSSADGVELTSESDKQTYALIGEVAGIKSGNRVRVSGKKSTDKSADTHQFLVQKVSKDFGACEAVSQVR
jgi:hypothetical protein